MGPFPLAEVNRRLAAGRLKLTDLGWYEGIPTWIPLSEVPGVSTAPPESPSQARTGQPPATAEYAGFWIRALAYIIDLFIIGALVLPLRVLFLLTGQGGLHAGLLIPTLISFLYWTLFWSSSLQATPPQKLLGLRVVNAEDGRRISFARAAGRWFGLLLATIILFIGLLMVAFTQRKQGLHDMIARTYVLKGP